MAEPEDLYRVHAREYVDAVYNAAPIQGSVRLDPDTSMNPHTLAAALRAAGSVIHAVDLVLAGNSNRAFCCVRPPGHHAEHQRAMGFCIFNNIAAGAAYAIASHGIKRIAIVDFDVHHGNGTEDIFKDNTNVLLCSSFQHPFYPYTGADTHSSHIINVPLAAGTDGKAYREVVENKLLPELTAFKPELIMISAGFDAHADDPLADLCLQAEDYAWITAKLVEIASEHARGRIISVLEGGYSLKALASSSVAHCQALLS